MTTDIQNYTIPLRKDYLKVPKHKRSKRAISKVKKFVKKHTKAKTVKLGNTLNQHIWKDGIKNPPGKVEVEILKEDQTATVDLVGELTTTTATSDEKNQASEENSEEKEKTKEE